MSNWNVFKNGWESDGTVCGWGSEDEHTKQLRTRLPFFIEQFNIQSVADAGCGDLRWVKQTNWKGATYHGYDLFPQYEWQLAEQEFPCEEVNIAEEMMDHADLIICRDVFIHWPNDEILKALDLFKTSGAQYLLSTSYGHDDKDVDNEDRIRRCSLKHSKLNLHTEPFDLGTPKFIIPESCHNYEGWEKYMGFWEL